MKNQRLVNWLSDAYAMEQNLIQVLDNHARLAADLPEFRQRLEQHRTETYGHREEIGRCLRLLGQEPSTLKAALATATGFAQGVVNGMMPDTILKNALSDYAAESMEIASYTALIAAAKESGQTEIAEICSRILDEEVEMAAWIEASIPELSVLTLRVADTEAPDPVR